MPDGMMPGASSLKNDDGELAFMDIVEMDFSDKCYVCGRTEADFAAYHEIKFDIQLINFAINDDGKADWSQSPTLAAIAFLNLSLPEDEVTARVKGTWARAKVALCPICQKILANR
ncbi:MAG TPA: hypothetical protein VKK79_12545 [Candidatus Lokiarchaeia archaeon]|nr:hypothetical protein [Candidatus Lokiarchaeia archaeon]